MVPVQSQSWIDLHAGAVQAICAALGLIGLVWYCILTLEIRRAAVRQANAAIRPFIVIDEMRDSDVPNFAMNLKPVLAKKIYLFRNLGTGPAHKLKWHFADQNEWNMLGDLAVQDWSHISSSDAGMMFERPQCEMVLQFEDSAGNTYETKHTPYKHGLHLQNCRLVRNS